MIKRICVYCGSSFGENPAFQRAAHEMGATLAQRGIALVYGGGKVGLMGEVARAVIAGGGEVIGVIPRQMAERELAFTEATDLRVVENMHERKALMADLADGFIALPGGIGTLEEIAEVLTWSQLGLHQKPCGLLDVDGYFDSLTAFLDQMVKVHFLHKAHRDSLLVYTDPAALLAAFETYAPPRADKVAMALEELQRRAEGI